MSWSHNALSGTVKSSRDGRFGFIKDDSSEKLFFFLGSRGRMPITCLETDDPTRGGVLCFGDEPITRIPQPGDRLLFSSPDPNDEVRRLAQPWCFEDDWRRLIQDLPQIRVMQGSREVVWQINLLFMLSDAGRLFMQSILGQNGITSDMTWWTRQSSHLHFPGYREASEEEQIRMDADRHPNRGWVQIKDPRPDLGL